MLRHVVSSAPLAAAARRLGKDHSSVYHSGRRLFTTSREKRALNLNQIKGAGEEQKASPSTPPPSSGGGGGSSPVPMILGGLAVVGAGVAYSQGWIPGLSQHPEEAAEQKAAAAAAAAGAVVKKDGDKEKAKDAPSTSSSSGNRVVKIELPKGSKRSAPPAASVIGHPIGGNKVEMNPAPATTASGGDASHNNIPTVDTALEELKSKLSQETSLTLQEARRELAKLSTMAMSELDEMSPTQLKIRLIQLAKDLEERTKWEAVRLKEFLAMKEKEVEDK